ncbi:MAG: RNA-binding S4 domain-containing protein [Bacteroidales bacterium]|nr:RNA-binding S4 domain-containing protein [Bacteroidales bacterium]
MQSFQIHTEYITLIQLLKAANMAESGGQAKQLIEEGLVLVNGEKEFRKRKKLQPGNIVTLDEESILIKEGEHG